ncbi:hypothetical protein AA0111_g12257 [Alternaria arborescens]|uniref:hypothetical protein n=1 Tax=Alternaria arborescens TaxID=156630 RepID=UPI001074C947|nr:hypothetical protein AA0111_g12257 [Alternaria arborescens]RYO13356.1 hypothetical protein AA0111_g12257 [Alternaria arborescens]
MQFSKISCLSVLALASSAMAAADPVVNVEGSVEVVPDVVEKRLAPIAIALIKVIGGQLLAGAAKIAVDATKAHLEVEKADFNNFDDAREAFTKSLSKDLYEKRVAGVKGVACYNGPYAFSSGASYEGPITVKFEWDMYNTDYDCFEIKSGTAINKGDGGFINIAYYGQCQHAGAEYRC